jgi:hypothetical protein
MLFKLTALIALAVVATAAGPCPAGWVQYPNKGQFESRPSCVLLTFATVNASFTTFDDVCSSLRATAHAASFASAAPYRRNDKSLIRVLVDALGDSTEFAVVGCSQNADIPSENGLTGYGWSWSDGTDASNLNCPKPKSGSCKGTRAWGATLYEDDGDNVWLSEPT